MPPLPPQPPQPMQPPGAPKGDPIFAPPMGSPAGLREPGIGMSSDQMKAALAEMTSKVMGKYNEFNANHSIAKNRIDQMGPNILAAIYDFFESVGVDPDSQEEVAAYMQKLRETNPELCDQLETMITRAMKRTQPAQEEEPIGENMNINPNEELSENL